MIGIYGTNIMDTMKAKDFATRTGVPIINDFGGCKEKLDLICIHLAHSPFDLPATLQKFDQFTLERLLIICREDSEPFTTEEGVEVTFFNATGENNYQMVIERIKEMKQGESGENTKI